eukprot:8948014-Pyramimonas_sp.AAC.1
MERFARDIHQEMNVANLSNVLEWGSRVRHPRNREMLKRLRPCVFNLKVSHEASSDNGQEHGSPTRRSTAGRARTRQNTQEHGNTRRSTA